MIRDLSVRNLATLESVSVSFQPGLIVLTGETGAGKSLLIDAIGLALGDRADATLVRTGCARAQVTLTLDVGPALAETVAGLGFPAGVGPLVIEREVNAEGRSTARVNGQSTTVGQLKSLGTVLIDLHGQHDHQALLDPERQMAFLDDWIGEECLAAKTAMAEDFASWHALDQRVRHAGTSARERAQRLDLLRYQRDEIMSAEVRIGEFDELETQLSRLNNAQRLGEAVHSALDSLRHNENSAGTLTGKAKRELESVVAFDPALESPIALVTEAMILIDEAGLSLGGYVSELDTDPNAQQTAEDRRQRLRDLFRKYGEDEAAVLAHYEEVTNEIETLESLDEDTDAVVAARDQAQVKRDATASLLTAVRSKHAPLFATTVTETIHDLAMPSAAFHVRQETAPVSAHGSDAITFDFTANLGEEARAIHKVASGGEIARVMLAIKAASAGRAGVPTMIFDEVDTGLSGRAAALVARQMERLGQHAQVLVISHLPQMAARATHHARIEKHEANGRVATQINFLAGEARVAEVARLLAGETLTEEAKANARAMLNGSPGRDSNSHDRKAKGF